MRARLILVVASVLLATAIGYLVVNEGGAADDVAAVGSSLDEAGTVTIVGDDIIVNLSSGPIRLVPNADTRFFVCAAEDDCDEVEEDAFRDRVQPGDDIRVLSPNAELITPEATELPAAVWIVLTTG